MGIAVAVKRESPQWSSRCWLLAVVVLMTIECVVRKKRCDGHRGDCGRLSVHDGHLAARLHALGNGRMAGEYTLDRITVDGLTFSSRGIAHRRVGDAINVAQRAGSMLVHERDGRGAEDALVGTREFESVCDVLGDVVRSRVLDRESMMDA
jgi:hypothetical protein